MIKIQGTEEQELLQMITWPPLFLRKWSFAKGTVLQLTKIKGMGENELLQMDIWMIRPPLFRLQMVIYKEESSPDDQHFLVEWG